MTIEQIENAIKHRLGATRVQIYTIDDSYVSGRAEFQRSRSTYRSVKFTYQLNGFTNKEKQAAGA